jgi:hypothetical protein
VSKKPRREVVCVVKKLSPPAKPSAKLPPPQKHDELTQSWLYRGYLEDTYDIFELYNLQFIIPVKGRWAMAAIQAV